MRALNITAASLVAAAAIAFAVAGPLAAPAEPAPTSTPTPTAPTETFEQRAASLNCEAWQVPGWLGEDGLPTSCVNNEAVPGSHKGEPPAAATPTKTPEPAPEPAPAPAETTTPPAPEAPATEKNGCQS